MLTNVYVDGLNLYHRAVKGTDFKWLDVRLMVESIFPDDDIGDIHYFSARVEGPRHDPRAPQRQDTYLRALRTLDRFHIHLGTIRYRRIKRALVGSAGGQPQLVRVRHPEEKKSDVNLATRLIVDACHQNYEQAILVTNDSDFAGALKAVRDEFNLMAVVLNPDSSRTTPVDLRNAATYVRRIRKDHLESAQLPASIEDAQGKIN